MTLRFNLSLLLTLCLLLANSSKSMAQESKPSYHNEAHVPAVQIVLSSYIKALKNMDNVLFQSLFYDQLSPIYGVYKENGKEVKIRLHASNFINQFIRAKMKAEQTFKNVDITTDGTIAVMNSDFEFYVDGAKTNWGRESWHLVNTLNGWKILSITFSIKPIFGNVPLIRMKGSVKRLPSHLFTV